MKLRLALLASFGFCSGIGLGPLVSAALSVAPESLLVAIVTTVSVFACFSGE
jgi:hypothetical protein